MVARWRINRLHLHVDGDVVQLLGLWASENIFFPLMRSGHRQPLNKQTRACHAASATLSPSMGDICNEHVSTLSVEIFGEANLVKMSCKFELERASAARKMAARYRRKLQERKTG